MEIVNGILHLKGANVVIPIIDCAGDCFTIAASYQNFLATVEFVCCHCCLDCDDTYFCVGVVFGDCEVI